ncbi:MAG: sialate O-acetylesterase [Chthoniobacteraceae bacterium]
MHLPRSAVFATLLVSIATPGFADVVLPPIFSDHAVLLKSSKTPVWGTAEPGEEIVANMGPATATTRATPQGKWQLALNLENAGPGPGELTIQGKHRIVLSDVVVGEVWLCSGQSNMELPLSSTERAQEEAAASANAFLREFRVEKEASPVPLEQCKGRWFVASPATALQFSAIGYYFGKGLTKEIGRPVGLIHSSWGGTSIEAWMPPASLPELKQRNEAIQAAIEGYPRRMAEFRDAYRTWATEHQRLDRSAEAPEHFAAADISTDDWKAVTMPGSLAAQGLPGSGAVWVRRVVKIPPTRANQYLPLFVGMPHTFDTVYWNGEKVGWTDPSSSSVVTPASGSCSLERRYDVPSPKVKEGDNTLAIRIFSPSGDAGIEAPYFCAAWNIPLGGTWLAKTEYQLPPLQDNSKAPAMPEFLPAKQSNPFSLYNAMIHPLAPYGIRGFLWYQGEANAWRGDLYRTELQLLIAHWRKEWKLDNAPFYLCQLANYQAKAATPGESAWAELRESQSRAVEVPHTGVAVLIDIGEQDDVHPRNKKEAAERLLRIALNQTYGKSNLPFNGPVYESAQREGKRMRLHFAAGSGPLVAKALPETYQPRSALPLTLPLAKPSPKSALQGFAICGEDRKWKWADAQIDGDTILVWSDEIDAPVAVRYAWADNPTCNLYNEAGLPASPFRTDHFPLTSEGRRF